MSLSNQLCDVTAAISDQFVFSVVVIVVIVLLIVLLLRRLL